MGAGASAGMLVAGGIGLVGAGASVVGSGVAMVQAVRGVPIPRWAGLAMLAGTVVSLVVGVGTAAVGSK